GGRVVDLDHAPAVGGGDGARSRWRVGEVSRAHRRVELMQIAEGGKASPCVGALAGQLESIEERGEDVRGKAHVVLEAHHGPAGNASFVAASGAEAARAAGDADAVAGEHLVAAIERGRGQLGDVVEG